MGTLVIDKFFRAISEQPSWQRLEGTVDDCTNFRVDLTRGAIKRNGTAYVGTLTDVDATSSYLILQIRDAILFVSPTEILAYDTNGTRLTVNGDLTYLSNESATVDDLRYTAAQDTIILLNRNVTPTRSTTPAYTFNTYTDYSELPDDVPNGRYAYAEIDFGPQPAGYYVKTSIGWERAAQPSDIGGAYEAGTMPHKLLRNSDGSFTFGPVTWTSRLDGDDETNPPITEAIIEVEFHPSGRLLLVTGTQFRSSQARDYFNLWKFSADQRTSSDPVNLDISLRGTGTPLYLDMIGTEAILICELAQIGFTSGDKALEDNNGRFYRITDFVAKTIRPALNGLNLTILDRNNIAHRYTFSDPFIQYLGEVNLAVPDILEDYTVTKAFAIDDTVYFATDTDTTIYNIFNSFGQELVQNAWAKMDFAGSIWHVDQWLDSLRLVVKEGSDVVLRTYTQKRDDDLPKLDNREVITTASFVSTTNETRIPVSRTPSTDYRVVTSSDKVLSPTRLDTLNNNIFVRGDITGETTIYAGTSFTSSLTTSKLYLGKTTASPMLNAFSVFFDETESFTLTVNAQGRAAKTMKYSSFHPGLASGTDDLTPRRTRSVRFPMSGDARYTDIVISDDSPASFTLSALEYKISRRGRN